MVLYVSFLNDNAGITWITALSYFSWQTLLNISDFLNGNIRIISSIFFLMSKRLCENFVYKNKASAGALTEIQ